MLKTQFSYVAVFALQLTELSSRRPYLSQPYMGTSTHNDLIRVTVHNELLQPLSP